jgi:hypothetical protein
MVSNPVWEICEHVAEVQRCSTVIGPGGEHSAADVRRRGLELRGGADHNGGILGNEMSVPPLASMRGASVERLRCQIIPDQVTSRTTRRQNRAS